MKNIEAGDLVTLKSGGPLMTVEGVTAGQLAKCVWANDGSSHVIERGEFPVVCLKAKSVDAAPDRPGIAADTVVTFDEFVQYGRDHGANIVSGMPWSFSFHGCPVTHENDQCYLIMVPTGLAHIGHKDLRFTPADVLILDGSGRDPDGISVVPANAIAHHPV